MFQYLGDLIYWHYSDVTLRRSEQQIEREKFLFYGRLVPFNRRMLVPAAILVHLCIGSVYSWSVFNIPIETELNLAAGTAANTFYIAIGFLGFSAALLGPVLERHGPQPILVFSVTVWHNTVFGKLYYNVGDVSWHPFQDINLLMSRVFHLILFTLIKKTQWTTKSFIKYK